jgi:hypothetical protein
MKEFELRQQFQGAAQTDRFAPIQAVDPTPQMRENQRTEQQNMQRTLDATLRDMQQQEDAMRVAKSMELEQLQGFSSKLMETLTTAAEGYAQNQADKYFAEGMADATKMQAMQPDYDLQEAALEQDDREYQAGVDQLEANGAPPDVVARMRGLSGWAAYGYKRGVATSYGDGYSVFVDTAFAEDNTTKLTLDGVEFTPATAQGADQKRLALSVIQSQYRRIRQLEEISPGMLNKYVMPQMRNKELQVMTAARAQETKEIQQEAKSQALTELGVAALVSADPNNRLLQDAMDKLRRTGLTAPEAREIVFKHLLELQSVGPNMGGISEDQVNLILDSTNNYMGKSWRNAFGSELATARYEMSKQRLARDQHEDAVEDQEVENFARDFVASLNIKENGAPPEDLINRAIKASYDRYGRVDPLLTNLRDEGTQEAGELRDQQQAADIMIREGDFTSNVLNSPKFSRLQSVKEYVDAAELIDERYGVNGRSGIDTKIYVDGVQQAVVTAVGMTGGNAKDLAGQNALVAKAAEADLHRRARQILMDPNAPEDMTWQKAYDQALLAVEADILGKKGIYTREGAGSQSRFSNEMFRVDPNLSSERGEKEIENVRATAIARGRAGLISNVGDLFTENDLAELSDPTSARGAGTLKLRRYVEHFNLQNPNDQITFDEARSLLLGVDPPPKDEYEGTAAALKQLELLTSPTPNRVSRVGVAGSHPPAIIREGPAGFHDATRVAQEYGMPEAIAPLAGVLYQRDGMSEEYETEHARIKALADILGGFPEVKNATTPGEAIKAYALVGDFDAKEDADNMFVEDAYRRLKDAGIDPDVPYINKPLVEGLPFSNPAVMGAAAREFLTGNTGASTGPHVHVKYNNHRGQHVDPTSILNRLLVDGKPIDQVFRETSGYGPRIHPVYGVPKFHNGIDFATPKNTRISVSGAEYLKTEIDPGGGGVMSIYVLPDGSEILLMHGSRANLQ